MNIKQMLAEIAKPLLRPMPGPLREMGDAELAAAITALEERVIEGELVVARLQPELETAAAESFAGADLGSVKNNATAMRDAESALTTAKTTLAGLRHERERRATESVVDRAARKREAAEAALETYIEAAAAMDAKTAEFVATREDMHAAREDLWKCLPEKTRSEFCRPQLLIGLVDEKLRNILVGATNGQLVRTNSNFSPFEIRQQPNLAEFVSGVRNMLPSVVFSGEEK